MEAASKTENTAGQATQQVFLYKKTGCPRTSTSSLGNRSLIIFDVFQLESESEKELRQHLENLKILKSDPLPENGVDEDDVDYDPGNDSSRL